ncbi:MAG: alpha/beta fold hydrolase [Planctomycetes bacterium]|nr:alpha/beta fold hydrolase [Planctomycetota bacterium]
MNLALLAALSFTAPTVAIAGLVMLFRWLRKKPVAGFALAALWSNAALFVLHLFVSFPLVLGYFGVHGFGSFGQWTRGDERNYAGPRLDASGQWLIQSSDTLRAEARGELRVDTDLAAAASARAVLITGADGNLLRAFRVESRLPQPRAIAILVHGLFRGGLELEPPANMFRQHDCECWLLEQRGHGGSTLMPMRFDDSEARDLVKVVEFVQHKPGNEHVPIVLFGVSIGTVAVLLALPQLPTVAGVVLDAPVEDLLATARRMMQRVPPGSSRRATFCEPWTSLIVAAIEFWSGCQLGAIAPLCMLQGLPADLPVLVIGSGSDGTVPPEIVQQLYDNLPMPTGVKTLWIEPIAAHGKAWQVDPKSYERQLAALLMRLRAPR